VRNVKTKKQMSSKKRKNSEKAKEAYLCLYKILKQILLEQITFLSAFAGMNAEIAFLVIPRQT